MIKYVFKCKYDNLFLEEEVMLLSAFNLTKHLLQYIDYFETSKNGHNFDVIPAYTKAIIYACKANENTRHKIDNAMRMSLLDSVTEQMLRGKAQRIKNTPGKRYEWLVFSYSFEYVIIEYVKSFLKIFISG